MSLPILTENGAYHNIWRKGTKNQKQQKTKPNGILQHRSDYGIEKNAIAGQTHKKETNRFPWKVLNLCTNNPKIIGCSQKIKKHRKCITFQNLNIKTHKTVWIHLAEKGWGDLVERKFRIILGTYVPFKFPNQIIFLM